MTTFPTINLNGTDAKDLLQQNVDVLTALEALREAMAKAAPHGRDYQTMPDGSYERAHVERSLIWKRFIEINDHFADIATNIQGQIIDRKKPSVFGNLRDYL